MTAHPDAILVEVGGTSMVLSWADHFEPGLGTASACRTCGVLVLPGREGQHAVWHLTTPDPGTT